MLHQTRKYLALMLCLGCMQFGAMAVADDYGNNDTGVKGSGAGGDSDGYERGDRGRQPRVSPTPSPSPTPTPAPALDGAALYNSYCAGCHGTSKRGSSATRIQAAINNNVGGMGFLRTLTAAQVTAISQY